MKSIRGERRLCWGRTWSSCSISYKSIEGFCGGRQSPPQTQPITEGLMPGPCSSLPRNLGTQHHYIWQLQDKLLHLELPHVSLEPPHRRGHTWGMTKWAEENRLHTNAYKIKPPQFQCFLPYVVMSRGFINKSCVSRGLNLNRAHFTSASCCFLADCLVSTSVGITWCSAPKAVSQDRAWARKWLEPK